MYSQRLALKKERFAAFIIDYAVFFCFFLVFGILFGEERKDSFGFVITDFPSLILSFIGFILWPLSEAYSGQTIGKKMMKLKVVNLYEREISTSQAFSRFFFGLIDATCMGVGLFVAMSNKNNQRIGDLVAKTIVIDLKKSK